MASQKELIERTHDKVIELRAILLGSDSDSGLVGEIKEIKTDVRDLNNRHRKLSKSFWILVGILVGSGILGSGIYTLLNGG